MPEQLLFFNKKFEEHEKDRELDDKLKFETSGITLKLIQAYERLVENKVTTQASH